MCRILALLVALGGCAAPAPAHRVLTAPRIAYHQHLMSVDNGRLIDFEPIDAAGLIRLLDDAGIEHAVVLSTAYMWADERKDVSEPAAKVRRENDWTADQVAKSGGRLTGFCSVNPLADGALAEVDRCTKLPDMNGLKLHFGNSGVSLRNPSHLARMKILFGQLNKRRTPMTIHMRARGGVNYGAEDARIFIDQLLPYAPDSVVTVAHMGGAGPGFPAQAEEVMEVLAEALASREPHVRNLFVDVATVATTASTVEEGETIARLLRKAGMERVLFGSDFPSESNPAPAGSWAVFRDKVPLTQSEFQTIMGNVAPYLGHRYRRR